MYAPCPFCRDPIQNLVRLNRGNCGICYTPHSESESEIVVPPCCKQGFCMNCLGGWVATCNAMPPRVFDLGFLLSTAESLHLRSMVLPVPAAPVVRQDEPRMMVWMVHTSNDEQYLECLQLCSQDGRPVSGLISGSVIGPPEGYEALYLEEEDEWIAVPDSHVVQPQSEPVVVEHPSVVQVHPDVTVLQVRVWMWMVNLSQYKLCYEDGSLVHGLNQNSVICPPAGYKSIYLPFEDAMVAVPDSPLVQPQQELVVVEHPSVVQVHPDVTVLQVMVWMWMTHDSQYKLCYEDGSLVHGLERDSVIFPFARYKVEYVQEDDCWVAVPLWTWWNNRLYLQDEATGWWSDQVDNPYICPISPPPGFYPVYDVTCKVWKLVPVPDA